MPWLINEGGYPGEGIKHIFKIVGITIGKDTEEEKEKKITDSIQIKKNKDGEVIANAFVTPEKISIILNEGIGLTDEIPQIGRASCRERV